MKLLAMLTSVKLTTLQALIAMNKPMLKPQAVPLQVQDPVLVEDLVRPIIIVIFTKEHLALEVQVPQLEDSILMNQYLKTYLEEEEELHVAVADFQQKGQILC